jgi:hypothetical protein
MAQSVLRCAMPRSVDILRSADRGNVLRFLCQQINELTIYARANYDAPDSHKRLIETNEAIHHLLGHLRDLLKPSEELTASRAEGILEQAALLSPHSLLRPESFLK